uniref:Uncharacterized protein n=1 Tax=Anopheles dirus TaxID=7168 RepID=A0A182NYQ2_9DIPT
MTSQRTPHSLFHTSKRSGTRSIEFQRTPPAYLGPPNTTPQNQPLTGE